MEKIEIVQGKETKPFDRRIATHSHIRGLGLDEHGIAENIKGGFVGQVSARTAMGIILDVIKLKKMAGRAILLVGTPGTGKTALALALSHELGSRVPFTPMVGSEVFSAEVKKTEILMENFRRSIGLCVRETKQVYEGEVTLLTPVETENPFGGYGKALSHVLLGLRTSKGTKQLKLDPSLFEPLQKERVTVGDVIYIESGSGLVRRMGRCDTFISEADLEAEEYVPLPKGDVLKKKEVIQEMTLHDLDIANSRPQGKDVASLVGQLSKPKKTEITDKLRLEINKIVDQYIEKGQAELVPGVLFIDEAHMLDMECFSYLNRALESSFSPIVILATNRGMSEIRGSEKIMAAHGMPSDLLDRLVIIRTSPYSQDEMVTIIGIRAKTEGTELEPESLNFLSTIALQSSLRYALQLLGPSRINSEVAGRNHVSLQDVELAKTLFIDTKSSVSLIRAAESKFLTDQ